MYNTPAIRNGGFGALQVEAVTNRPLSIARRHLAASQLRMRDIEPDALSSSEWVRFLVMEEQERDRWMTQFLVRRRRRDSDESTSSGELDPETALLKAEEARLEAAQETSRDPTHASSSSSTLPLPSTPSRGRSPSATLWVRQYEAIVSNGGFSSSSHATRPPVHHRRAVTTGLIEAPPTYESAVRASTPPPAYQTRLDYDRARSPDLN